MPKLNRDFPGAQYADALPTGQFAVQIAQGFQTDAGTVPFPSAGGVLHHRVGLLDGVFCIAGQGHQDGQCWLWNGEHWKAVCPSYGTSVACFGPLGLYVSTPNATDNIKVFNRQGHQIAALTKQVGVRGIAAITGAGTSPGDVRAVDQWYGVGGLAEYTDCNGYLVGQSALDGLVIKWDADAPSLLEPGDVQFCRARFESGQFVAAAWKPKERRAVIRWFAVADLNGLPRVRPVEEPPVCNAVYVRGEAGTCGNCGNPKSNHTLEEPVEPPVEPPIDPEVPVAIPDHYETVARLNSQYPALLQQNTLETCGKFTEMVVMALAAEYPREGWGHVGKSGGQTQCPCGRGHAADAIMSQLDVSQVIDIIAGAHNPPHPGQPAWQPAGAYGQPWKPPLPLTGGGTQPPIEPPPVQPPPVDTSGLVARIATLEQNAVQYRGLRRLAVQFWKSCRRDAGGWSDRGLSKD